jgi:digeranylgeranylglycerophospholipid reductase
MAPTLKPKDSVKEVVVVGGGPSGSFTALNLAKLGTEVTVFEEHGEIGTPSHCAGHLSIHSLLNLGLYPLPERIVENTFSQANFYSPTGFKFSIQLAKPVTCSINREAFDKLIAEKAEAAGAQYRTGSRVESLLIQNNLVRGVKVKQDEGIEKVVPAKIVVDAEGISSRLLKQAGLTGFNPDNLVLSVEAEVENVKDLEHHAVEVFLGNKFSPGFYAWIIPRLDGTAKVGLAVNKGNPKEFLRMFMFKHPIASRRLGTAKITQIAFHSISLGGAIPKTYSSGFLAVGDAASQVKPTTGGGVVFGLTCSRIAAQVATEALQKDDVSSGFLQLYQQRCFETLGFDLRVMLKLRNFLDSLSDRRLDEAFKFFSRIGLAKTLENVEEIDFQGQELLRVMTKPPVLAALTYLLLLYLYANPLKSQGNKVGEAGKEETYG